MPAVPAMAGSQAPALLPFRHDTDEPSFPVAGIVFLIVLLVLAVWLRWGGQRRGGWGLRPGAPWRWTSARGEASSDVDKIDIVASARLDMNTRLHAVQWRGRHLLVAISGSSPPTVLDREGSPPNPAGGAS
jgi:hypothetical protein